MVDRYLLPIPKARNLRSYVRLKNKPMWSIPYMVGVLTLTFQINRYLSVRSVSDKSISFNFLLNR